MSDMETQIYQERKASMRFRRRAGLAVLLCLFGVMAFGGFLVYRHHHPISMEPIDVVRKHTCPHPECSVNGHSDTEQVTEYAPPILASLLLAYCAVVGIGAFVVEVD